MKKMLAVRNKVECKNVITKAPFREVYESIVGINNKHLVIKITRIYIRFFTRFVGYSLAAKGLGLMLLAFKQDIKTRNVKYVRYIIELNKIRIEYLNCLSNNNLHAAVFKKNQWAEFVLRDSMSPISRWSAKGYLSLLSRNGYCGNKYDAPSVCINGRSSENFFYIYGPNSSAKPSRRYKDYILVMMKPVAFDVSLHEKKILFINSAYYNIICKDENLRNDIIKTYRKIYVSCRNAVLPDPFIRSKLPMGDQLASPMALGRVLYNLIREHGKFSCVIEGFDFYLDSTMYGSYYPTLTRDKNNTISEQVICSSLADHDALYNFLYVKEMVRNLDIVDSINFKRVIDLSAEGYLNELSKSRDFKSLRY